MANKTLMAAHLDEVHSVYESKPQPELTFLFNEDDEIESRINGGRLRTRINEAGDITHEWYQDDAQIKLEGYNEAPTANQAREFMTEWHLDDILQPADAADECWKNDGSTLVLKIKGGHNTSHFNIHHGIALAKMAAEFHASEIDTRNFNYESYIRIWWD